MSLRQAAEKALEELECWVIGHGATPKDLEVIAALRAALTEADEPVAWMVDGCVTVREDYASLLRWNVSFVGVGRAIPDSWKPLLFTHPPRREPLTEGQLLDLPIPVWVDLDGAALFAVVRAVERAHGIGGDE